MSYIIFLMSIVGLIVLAIHALNILELTKVWFERWNKLDECDPRHEVEDLVNFSISYTNFSPNLDHLVTTTKDDFLKSSLQTLLNGSLKNHDLLKALRTRAQADYEARIDRIVRMNRKAHYLPLIGWVVGIGSIAWLFSQSGQTIPAGISTVLPYCLGAVLYSLVFYYALLKPACYYLSEKAKAHHTKNLLVLEGVSLLVKEKQPYEILEALNLNLPEQERLQWRKVFDEAGGGVHAA